MNNASIITNLSLKIKARFQSESSGHDWLHIERVWKTAKRLARGEKVNMFVIDASALLHDVGDWKFHDGKEKEGSRIVREILKEYKLSKSVLDQICDIVDNVSFKGAGVKNNIKTLEGMIVQDADRLDAMGAIGIARTFQYGGYCGRPLYDPVILPRFHKTKDEYKRNKGATINHFFEKLLLLKDMMNTKKANKIAQQRHRFMLRYVQQFIKETGITYKNIKEVL